MLQAYLLLWFPMVFIAIFNATLRELWYARVLPERTAHQVSSATAVIFFGIYTWAVGLKWPITTASDAWGIGAMWLLLTVAFEFLFGRYVMRHPWDRLLVEYHLLRGRVWSLVLLAILCLPWLVFRLCGV